MENIPENPNMHSMAAHDLEMQMHILSVPPLGSQPQAPGVLHTPVVPPPLMPPPGLAMMHPPTQMIQPAQQTLQPPPGLPPALQQSNWADDLVGLDADGSDLPSLMAVRVDRPDDDEANGEKNGSGVPEVLVLPKALEDVFAFKDQLADELGRADGEIPVDTTAQYIEPRLDGLGAIKAAGVISGEYADADGDSDEDENNFLVPSAPLLSNKAANRPDNKNKKKKKRKQLNRQKKAAAAAAASSTAVVASSVPSDKDGNPSSEGSDADSSSIKMNGEKKASNVVTDAEDEVTVEYVPDKITVAELAPMYRQFYRVFELFKLEDRAATAAKEAAQASADEKAAQLKKDAAKQLMLEEDDDDMDDDQQKDDKERLSKRKLKKLTRLSVAELKQLVQRPDVVEMHDVTARDPKLLVQLKAHRNTVQVPRHWCFKRKYLQGKRGIEKPPFDLPAFIKKTGIMEMRASLQEKDEAKTLKAKMRERARPKMGKIDIDYQKLHDAFFKWQTKPRMTIHGDLYYEGKEFETRLKEKKPGDLSEELRTALGMPIGPNCHKIPPPWLIAQQRYGPPPSYPNLKIPGLNAPIPEGTSFGYHAGGWGKPPVDEKGKPLYGDVFGTNNMDPDGGLEEGDIDRNMWGELESESEESSEEEEDEGEDLADVPDESGLVTPAEGLVTPSGLTSGVPPGLETPDTIELRKKKIENEMEDNETPVLYQVLPEKRGDRIGASMMGSTHVYDMSTAAGKPPPNLTANSATSGRGVDREGMVELALDPSELDMDNEAMAQRYEQQMREQQSHLQKEDLSDMLAEHVARQKSKRKRQQGSETTAAKQTKKYKEFKF